MEVGMKIGEVAKKTGVGIETIRFYEKQGLMMMPSRLGRYRNYDHKALERIHFIRSTDKLLQTKEALEVNRGQLSSLYDWWKSHHYSDRGLFNNFIFAVFSSFTKPQTTNHKSQITNHASFRKSCIFAQKHF